MEQEKFDLQKKHTGNIQKLLEDTNQRLGKMEAEYSSQTQATVSAFTHTSTLFNGNIQCLALFCGFYIQNIGSIGQVVAERNLSERNVNVIHMH